MSQHKLVTGVSVVNGQTSLSVSSPPYNATVSGTVQWVSVFTFTGTYPVEAFMLWVDGVAKWISYSFWEWPLPPEFVSVTPTWNGNTCTITTVLDTTKLGDGSHDLQVGWIDKVNQLQSVVSLPITTANGSAVRATLSDKSVAYAVGDDSVASTAVDLHCDGSITPAATQPSPVPSPLVRKVYHRKSARFDGQTKFWNHLFFVTPDILTSTPGLGEAVVAAGCNVISVGATPGLPSYPTLEAWKQAFDIELAKIIAAVNLYGFDGAIITMDGLWRSQPGYPALEMLQAAPFWRDLIRYFAEQSRDSGKVLAFHGIDETEMVFGGGPNEFIKDVVDEIRSVRGAPPFMWSATQIRPENVNKARWWQTPALCDGSDVYYENLAYRDPDPNRVAIANMDSSMELQVKSVGQYNQPWTSIVGVMGRYELRSNGNVVMTNPPTSPQMTCYMAAASLIHGAVGFHVYAYDFWLWKQMRENNSPNGEVQTGASPFGPGEDRWLAMSVVLNFTHAYKDKLFQPRQDARQLGPDWLVGEWGGEHGKLGLFANRTEQPKVFHAQSGYISYKLMTPTGIVDVGSLPTVVKSGCVVVAE